MLKQRNPMQLEDFLKLQNGSDIRGVAMEGIAGEEVNLTQDSAMKIGYTFAEWLMERTGKKRVKIAVGRDSRLTGEYLAQAVTVGLVSKGTVVFDCGIATTPAMFMTTMDRDMDCDGAIMVTASHLPFNRNGMKFFTKDGGLNKKGIREILELAYGVETTFTLGGQCNRIDYIEAYAGGIVATVRSKTGEKYPLKGAHIVLDAGNGAGGFFEEMVLKPLGADTTGSQFLEPDGRFPNHVPNPEDSQAVDAITRAVLDNKADMGIIFDTDVDRAAIIDEKGNPINRNRFIAFISKIVLENYPGTCIVTDSITSTGLTEYIEALGGKHHRFKRGYRNVIDEAVRLNEAGIETHLAMETSGHGAIKENYFLDDGSYLVTLALIRYAQLSKEGGKLSDVLADLKEPAEEKEVRLRVTAEDFKGYGERVLDAFSDFIDKQEGATRVEPNYEGIRVDWDKNNGDGWCLLRLSLHDPLLPLNIESDTVGGVAVIENNLKKFFEQWDQLIY